MSVRSLWVLRYTNLRFLKAAFIADTRAPSIHGIPISLSLSLSLFLSSPFLIAFLLTRIIRSSSDLLGSLVLPQQLVERKPQCRPPVCLSLSLSLFLFLPNSNPEHRTRIRHSARKVTKKEEKKTPLNLFFRGSCQCRRTVTHVTV